MAGFEELGINDALIARAQEQGFDTPSALQRSVIPVLRRGGNAIIRASSGSGITSAYAMALVDRFGDSTGTRALVIAPTADRAERIARTIAQYAHGTAVRVAALTSTWPHASNATIIVASAEKVLSAVQASQLKVDGLDAVVLDNAAATVRLVGEDALQTIFSSLPREGQRVFITTEMTEPVRKLAEAHARKAIAFPARPAVADNQARAAATTTLQYVVASGDKKVDAIARLASEHTGPITVLARSSASAREAERQLSARGFHVRAATYDGFDEAEIDGVLFAYDAPFTGEQITDCLGKEAFIICEREELPHLKMIAEDANVKLQSAKLPPYEADSLNAFRNEIRRAAREEDLEAQMLVLEPLFNEMSPEEVAAAAASLLRARRPAKAEVSTTGRPDVTTFARLFLSIGERDGIRPGDLVGAITGESGVKGEEVGRVDIRDTFSVVEVASGAADRVIRALNGTTMKGRALRVDYDRKTSGSGPRAPRGRPAGPRREGREGREGRAPTRRDR